MHEGSNASDSCCPAALPRDVRESLKSAVMESGIPGMRGDADGRLFDLALDEV